MTRKADAIITADWHITGTPFRCRTDDVLKTQWNKVEDILWLQREHKCPILIAGDIFDKAKPPLWVVNNLLVLLKQNEEIEPRATTLGLSVVAIPGNHDMPNHNRELLSKSAYGLLGEALNLNTFIDLSDPEDNIYLSKKYCVVGFGFDNKLSNQDIDLAFNTDRKVALAHMMTYKGRAPYPGCTAPGCVSLLKQFPEYDLIVTGDNHKTFTAEYEGRLLINPGSMLRKAADQINHKPCVFLWYADDNTCEPHYLPAPKDAITTEHLEEAEEHDLRIQAFANRLDGKFEAGLNFTENLKNFLRENKVPDSVQSKIWEAVDNG